MDEEENIFGKHFDVEEFIRAAKGSGPATLSDTPNTSAAPRDLELTVREKIDFALLFGLVADVLPKDRVSLCLDGRRAPKRQRCDEDEALCLVADVLPRDRVSLGLDGRRAPKRQRCDDDDVLCLVADVLPRDRVSLCLVGRRAPCEQKIRMGT